MVNNNFNRKPKKNASLGTVGMILGIVSLVLSCLIIGGLVGIAGFIISIVAISNKEMPRGKAVAGIVLNIMALWLAGGVLLITVLSPEESKTDKNNVAVIESTKNPVESKDKDNSDDKQKGANKPKNTPKPTKKPKTKKEIKNDYIRSCKEYGYKKVLRNPDNYIGKKVKIKVKISSVHEKGFLTPTKYYFAYSKGDYGWYGNEYGIFDKRDAENPKLLEDDIIEVYGEIAEPEETSSLIVNSQELFCIDMKYVKLISE